MKTIAAGLLALGVVVSSCAGHVDATAAEPTFVADRDLEMLLLDKDEINTVMGTKSMTAQPLSTTMADNRALLPNLNCLGVWQVNESAIYGPDDAEDGWSAVRAQTLRTPDNDNWDSIAIQSAVSYPSPDAARAFFTQSADRWSQCTNHKVNIMLNDRQLPKWLSGDLGRTDTRLAMPIARGVGQETKQCQHVLEVVGNVILDVETCKPRNEGATEAGEIADVMKDKFAG